MNPVDDWIDKINRDFPAVDSNGKQIVHATRNYRVTLSMPCWGRPLRTKRAIECILAQDIQGWEAIVIGDKCPHFQKLIDSGWIYDKQTEALSQGNKLVAFNAEKHTGGCGFALTNFAIQNARGKYLLFFANDDYIQPNHFSNYLEIEDTDYDYLLFNSYISPLKETRVPDLGPCRVGHSEIIVRTSLAKKAPPHQNKYGHDWDFIRYISQHGTGAKAKSEQATYEVRSVPNFGTIDKID